MKQPTRLLLAMLVFTLSSGWGFFAHKLIQEAAVFLLPETLVQFYKPRIALLLTWSVAPDQRRYTQPQEAPRHYIDLDHYPPELAAASLTWDSIQQLIPPDSLLAHGIVPWRIAQQYNQLKEAFFLRQGSRILRLSAELGHYASDACVPLHTTSNYNGQLTGQTGIHALWESRLPELFASEYNLFFDTLEYLADPLAAAWTEVRLANQAVDSVLQMDRKLAGTHGRTFAFENRQMKGVRTISQPYARQYNQALHGMVERQLRRAVRFTAALWYSAWRDAGQPDLTHETPELWTSAAVDSAYHAELQAWKTGVLLNTRCDSPIK